MGNQNTLSYTSASGQIPAKLLLQRFMDKKDRILPLHLQLNPTNRCNLSCTFCSCANRDKNNEMPLDEFNEMVAMFEYLGTIGATITGGGDPLLHRNFIGLLEVLYKSNIKVGLVTNGYMLSKYSDYLEELSWIVWARISLSDETQMNKLLSAIDSTVGRVPIDWSFSYVYSSSPNVTNIQQCLDYAANNCFTHVRVVPNLLDDQVLAIRNKSLEKLVHNYQIAILQYRDSYTAGSGNCWLSLLKPVISAKGNMFPCCGVQYAKKPMTMTFDATMSMGHWSTFPDIFNKQLCFDGSDCNRCYYLHYNTILNKVKLPIVHREFV